VSIVFVSPEKGNLAGVVMPVFASGSCNFLPEANLPLINQK
jgi:hypothetical protein